ncbi:MAG: ABC transporter substrate-binding protein [Dermatophilaceae bacterium]
MIRKPLSVLAAAALTLLAACSSGSPSGTTTSSGAASGGGGGKEVNVAVIPIVDCAPAFLGVSKGFFAEEGLNVKITQVTGGAAAVSGVVGGSFDIGFGNPVSTMVAVDKGLALRYVSNGVTTSGKRPDFGAVVVKADSAIKTPADLAGKTVSVNNLSNIGDTTIRKIVEDAGGDPKTIKFVEVPFPDAPAALDRGQIDAAWLLEPFLSASVAAGSRIVTNNFIDFDPNLDIAGYFTKTENFDAKKDLVAAFQRGMKKSLDYANTHEQEVRDIVGTYTKISAADRAKMVMPRYLPDFHRDAVQKMADAMLKYGTVTKAVNVSAILPPS